MKITMIKMLTYDNNNQNVNISTNNEKMLIKIKIIITTKMINIIIMIE